MAVQTPQPLAKTMPNQIQKQSSADTNGPPQEAATIAEAVTCCSGCLFGGH